MKVILSRKGFDSGTGGYPSPLLVEQGRFVSLPIPEVNKIYKSDTGRRYSDLRVSFGVTYLALMEQLGIGDSCRRMGERLVFSQSGCFNAFVDEISQPIGYGSADGYKKQSKPLVDRQRSVVRAAVPNNHPSTNDTMTVTMNCRRASFGEIFDVIFDIADLEKVRKYEWKVQKSHDSVYAVLQGTHNILLHRLVCDDCLGKRVFSKNGNYFDCRRSNLYAR